MTLTVAPAACHVFNMNGDVLSRLDTPEQIK
jgi:hypothetical protein